MATEKRNMIAETTAFTLEGITARPVRVEVDVQRGLPVFQVVGLPDLAVRECRERVRAACINTGFEFPLRRITANLAPADLRKVGPGLDLPLAAALLAAAGEIDQTGLNGFALVGELALDGTLRPVRGALAMAEAARAMGCRGIIVPPANGAEAALAYGIEVRTISDVSQLKTFGRAGHQGDPAQPLDYSDPAMLPDLADLRGQDELRRTLEVAAAGGHGLLMVGPPGSGKSLAARRVPSILPPLDGGEFLEVARISSACGVGGGALSVNRPFRAPHHTVSPAGLVGGGSPPRPGEITLAHRGVLFLDEIAEFRRSALEALREPLETGTVEIVRANGRLTLPAEFHLIAAANPCACGRGENDPRCQCSEGAIRRYRNVLDGALSDRIDLHVKVDQPAAADIAGSPGESSAAVRERVVAARAVMADRYGAGRTNASATPEEVGRFDLTTDARHALMAEPVITGRTADRVLRVARTVADLAGQDAIREEDIDQAFTYTSRREVTTA